jgi:hypothetical protein
LREDGEPPLRPDNPALALAEPDQVCLSSIGHGWSQAGLRNASATMPGDLRAGSERSWIDGATFAQECGAVSPYPSAFTVTDSLIGFLVTEHSGVLIIEIDLTRIGLVSRTFSNVLIRKQSGSISAAEGCGPENRANNGRWRDDRSRTEFSLCIGPSSCVAGSSGIQRRV